MIIDKVMSLWNMKRRKNPISICMDKTSIHFTTTIHIHHSLSPVFTPQASDIKGSAQWKFHKGTNEQTGAPMSFLFMSGSALYFPLVLAQSSMHHLPPSHSLTCAASLAEFWHRWDLSCSWCMQCNGFAFNEECKIMMEQRWNSANVGLLAVHQKAAATTTIETTTTTTTTISTLRTFA